MSGTNSADDVRRYQEPYSGHRPVPTISRYREELALRQQEAMEHHETPAPAADEGLAELRPSRSALPTGPRPSSGLSIRSALSDRASRKSRSRSRDQDEHPQELPMIDTSQTDPALTDPRQRRKELGTKGKEKRRQRAEREVTDPVTHQTIIIQDFDDDALENVTFNDAATLAPRKSMSSSRDEPNSPKKPTDAAALHQEFPVPDFGGLRDEIEHISRQGATVGVFGAAIILVASYEIYKLLPASTKQGSIPWLLFYGGFFLMAYLAIFVRDYSSRQTRQLFEDEIWHAHREKMKTDADKSTHERTVWLNSVLRTLWPIINPDLFASFTDILEDVMQASIPKIVRMVSIEDIGQGSEPLRILGIRWLPSGATSETLRPKDGSVKDESSKAKEKDAAASNPFGPHVMDDEEGSFVNLEISFAYRTRASSRMAKHSNNDLHLFVAFYLPGNIKIPVWVNLHGIIGTIRARLQLIADPPFISLCTVTLMGQPKVAMSCVPLVQRGLNIMDVPLISNFVQAAVDAAVAQYVAPKSLTIDLQKILVGEDFKKNTLAKGILMVTIKRGYDFKMGDAAIPFFREGGSDPYVSVGWAKFGKVVWSSRIMYKEMSPCWDETCFVLVTPEELNIDERLRVQLWDSDRFTADDDLGRIEVSLKEIMENPESNGKMSDRADGFRALKSGDNMPGKLEWGVGYFPKTKILDSQFQLQTRDPRVRNMEQLNKKVQRTCERKLREAMLKDTTLERHEEDLEKKRVLEFKTEHDEMIISAPPPEEYPSGLLSIQIHNLTGLEVKKLSKEPKAKFGSASDDEEETGEGLPSSYCTILINHRKTFKSRVKPQNSKPFFNAGCERFIRDWRDCEVYVSVRDARLHEDDPLLGIVHLPLAQVFKQRSQVMGWWPISGGIGNGRIRISLVWRSVSLQAPRNLLGWQYGTLDIRHKAIGTGVPEELRSCKLRLQTNISTGKMYSSATEDGHAVWATKSSKHVALALHQRYSSCFSITFVDGRRLLGDRIAAFCVLWLKDIPDEEEQEIDLPIWKGDYRRAISNCMETCGDKLGTLKLRLTLWAGMGSAHTSWASGSEHLRQVVEVIDTARDILQTDDLEKETGIVDADNNGDQDGDSSDDEGADNDAETEDAKSQHHGRRGRKGSSPGRDAVLPDGSISDKQSMLDQVRDYKKKAKTLHRQHRGIMQWKIPRTAKWVKNKLGRVEDGVSGLFEHEVKQKADIETEV
ncbi:Meiotically up-regulated 190 protein [Beauveria bassiana]|uniref:Meiotically up-regulated 190 protein n=1 Tax=Beauveria bassiana TaxID=176275 RepID=A0A2N6NEH3_BEABA|nr:Meiotically up-regulated 190 protein [Beauveria bassiana]